MDSPSNFVRKRRRPKGLGRIYKRPDSCYYWIAYPGDEQQHRERTEFLVTERGAEERAYDRLRTQLAKVRMGKARRMTLQDLYDDVRCDYETQGRKSLTRVEQRWRDHLTPFFATVSPSNVTTGMVNRYKGYRLTQGKKPPSFATINHELVVLRRCFTLGIKNGKVQDKPWIPFFKRNARTNTLSAEGLETSQPTVLYKTSSE